MDLQKRYNYVWLVFGLFTFLALFYGCSYHLLHKEEISLFMFTGEFLKAYFHKPAWITCLLGDFCTQFFCIKGVGAFIIACIATAISICFYHCIRRCTNSKIWLYLSLLIGGLEAVRACQLIYPLSSSLSLLFGLVLSLWYGSVRSTWRIVIGLLIAAIGYILIGYGVFIFLLFVLFQSWKAPDLKMKIFNVLLMIFVGLYPIISCRFYLLTSKQAYFYPAIVEETFYNMPLYERILKLDAACVSENWEELLEMIPQDVYLNLYSYYYNMAYAAEGKLPEKIWDYYQIGVEGLFIPIDASSSYLTTLWSGELWFKLGDMTMAEHAYLLSMIFSPNHNGRRMIQRLAEINLINGDTEAARKYLRILSHTLFYKDWAEKRMPESLDEEVNKWLQRRRKLIPVSDTIRISTMDVVKSLRVLVKSCPENTFAYDYLLCNHLLSKDIDSFVQDYVPIPGKSPHRLYAEALLIDLFRKKASAKEIQELIIDPKIMLDFKEYNRLVKENPSLLELRFGKTYWYYYQFVTNKK